VLVSSVSVQKALNVDVGRRGRQLASLKLLAVGLAGLGMVLRTRRA
jgi:hypothetical protein